MKIGELAKRAGMSPKIIRHYESMGLVPKPKRTLSGYRIYQENDYHTLLFVKQARKLGFPLSEIKKLLGLWRQKSRKSVEVRSLALFHINGIEKRIAELHEILHILRDLVESCHGDDRPDCPILNKLETDTSSK